MTWSCDYQVTSGEEALAALEHDLMKEEMILVEQLDVRTERKRERDFYLSFTICIRKLLKILTGTTLI